MMMHRYTEKLVEAIMGLILFAIVAFVVVVALASVIVTVAKLVITLSIALYVYPWLHNGALALSRAIEHACASMRRDSSRRLPFAAFVLALWPALGLLLFGLVATLAITLAATPLSAAALGAAVISSALLLGLPIGAALALRSEPLPTPGGGPLARTIAFCRARWSRAGDDG